MRRRLHRVRWLEIRRLEEQPPAVRLEEHNGGEQSEEDTKTEEILHGVVRMERDAIQRLAVSALGLLDLDAVGVIGTHFVQRQNVRHHQTHQHERQRYDVQRKEAVQRDVRDVVVAADPFHQSVTDHRDGTEQRDDNLRTPERHVAPRQQVAHEGLRHERQVNTHAEEPQQFARGLVRTVHERTEHVEVHHDEERRGARGVQVADEPAPLDVAHDVLNGTEGVGGRGLVVHRQEDARDELEDQHEQGQRAEVIPDVEVLGRVVLGDMLAQHLVEREARVDPAA